MRVGTIDVDKLKGVGEKFVGIAVEATGVLIDNDRLQARGEAQQTKATEMLKALRSEAEAEASRKKAQALSTRTSGTDLGVLDEAKGRVKQAVGDVADRPDLSREGRTEQRKGAAQRKATKSQGEAKAHELKADAAEAREQQASE